MNDRLVFDCNVYLQALINPEGPGGRCVELAITDRIALFVSVPILDEIRALPRFDVCVRRRITASVVDGFVKDLLKHAT